MTKKDQQTNEGAERKGAGARKPSEQHWAKILEQVRTPLTFFGLALLVLMVTMGAVIAMSREMSGYQFAALCLMAVMFIAVIGVVAYLTIKWPANLLDKVELAQKTADSIERFLENPAFRDVIIEVVNETVKPEALVAISPRKPSNRTDQKIDSKADSKG